MRWRALVLAGLPLMWAATSCVHAVSSPAATRHPPLEGIVEVGLQLEVLAPSTLARAGRGEVEATEAALRERLLARGVAEVVATEEPAPGRILVKVWVLGERRDALTRWTWLPWGLVSVVTIGLVPFREAQETEVEVEVVDARAPRGGQIRSVRRSFTTSSWFWLPLLPFADSGRDRPQVVARTGLLRAVDDALDAALAP